MRNQGKQILTWRSGSFRVPEALQRLSRRILGPPKDRAPTSPSPGRMNLGFVFRVQGLGSGHVI